ncbi:AI-2E family transporter [Pseudonocardia sp. ICBG1293]|uniref:AI-2E family transporter n=1 Tax=Pseudonocardia sp. ICBG1293 TaxID=2844382 RepID=UPI001CC926D5|nr:AI-2E family transporter [Pseudonocardia sp. ICBG1293]
MSRRTPPTTQATSRSTVLGTGLTWVAEWSLRIALIGLGLVIADHVIGTLWVIVWPVVLAVLFSTVLRPPAAWLIRRRIPPAPASALVLLVALATVSGLLGAIAPSVTGQVQQISDGVVHALDRVQQWAFGPPLNLGEGEAGAFIDQVTSQLQQSAAAIAGGVLAGVSTIASGLLSIVLALVLTFFFVKDGPRFLPWLTSITGPAVGGHLSEVLSRMWSVLGGFLRVQALVSLIDAVFIGIGLVVLGVPLALPLAVLTFLGGFIPIVGAVVAGAMAVLIALVTQGFGTAVAVAVLVVAVQQIEGNVLQPFLQGQRLKLHGSVVLLAVTAGGSLFGIVGAFLAVPTTAVVAVLLRYLGEQIDRRDPRPTCETRPDDHTGSDGPPDDVGGRPTPQDENDTPAHPGVPVERQPDRTGGSPPAGAPTPE